MRQVVVWGPPCSGKSTYVQNAMKDNDLRYDLDLLDMAVSKRSLHTRQKSVGYKILLEFRRDFITKTQELSYDGTVYIIASYLSKPLLDILDERAEFVRMDTTEEVCLSRLREDSTRPDKEEWENLIREWFLRFGEKEKSFMQFEIQKAAQSVKAAVSETNMALINRQSLRDLTPDEVYTFKVQACNDLVDRDFERFPLQTLEKLAPMYVGRTMIADHRWSADNQRARIYETYIEKRESCNALMAKCYMLRNDSTKDIVDAIEGGILREVSVGCAVSRTVCSICGEEAHTCQHLKGAYYDGKLCYYDLLDPVDAYEMSFVAVPAQPAAGVTKNLEKHSWTPAEMAAAKARLQLENERWK